MNPDFGFFDEWVILVSGEALCIGVCSSE